ncbi:MAG: hypothetical protein LBH05_03315 [Deferribacteraceae bacterium]|jgi:hypothetical protein|nr:hypothetical protein [Deferribacteraceae bacterium]
MNRRFLSVIKAIICNRKVFSVIAAMFFVFACKSSVWAFSNSFAKTDVGYDLYDLVFNKALNGPIGWVLVAVLVIMGLVSLAKGQAMPSVMSIGSGVLIKATPSIMTSLGMLIYHVNIVQLVKTAGILIW